MIRQFHTSKVSQGTNTDNVHSDQKQSHSEEMISSPEEDRKLSQLGGGFQGQLSSEVTSSINERIRDS